MHVLLMWLNTVFLRRDQIKESLCTPIQFVQPAVAALLPTFTAVGVEDGEQELTVMKRAVFDGVVKLTDSRRIKFLLLDVAEVLKELLPTLTEEPRLVTTAPGQTLVVIDENGETIARTTVPESCPRPWSRSCVA
jgi:hypothetical protein